MYFLCVNCNFPFTDQRLDLHKFREEDPDIIKGQIVIMLLSREGSSRNAMQNVVISENGALLGSNNSDGSGRQGSTGPTPPSSSYVEGVDDLPEGWTECRSLSGRLFYMNHVNRTTQWDRPTQSATVVDYTSTPNRPS